MHLKHFSASVVRKLVVVLVEYKSVSPNSKRACGACVRLFANVCESLFHAIASCTENKACAVRGKSERERAREMKVVGR